MQTLLRSSTATLAGLLSAACANAVIINVDSTDGTGVTLTLQPGDYSLQYVTPSTPGAIYTAWNPWGTVNGCNGSGQLCSTGWTPTFEILASGTVFRYGSGLGPFATAESAFTAAVSTPLFRNVNGGPFAQVTYPLAFHLDSQTDIKVYIGEVFGNDPSGYANNVGGLSFSVTQTAAIPEPETYALMLFGLGLLGATARRKGKSSI